MDKICKTVHQYNKNPLPDADMKKLQEIAKDYSKVKNYVYMRFGGVGSLKKIYPGYTVQNEMTRSGLREQLNMPSVYFHRAVFDALGDIKSQWTLTKSKVMSLINQNERLTEEEKHYLRFLLKVSNAFEAVLNEMPVVLRTDIQKQHDLLAQKVDTDKMRRYLCRQVRKYHEKQHTDKAEGFSISERAYRYGDHGIYISVKEKRKRIFVSLTDNNQYESQMFIRLYPEEKNIEIKVPVSVTVRVHEDYREQVGLAIGMYTMLTTDEGNKYGDKMESYQMEYADWIRKQTRSYSQNRENNPGRKKYNAQKNRYEERLHSYINQELNRFLQTEKPKVIYMAKYPRSQTAGGVCKVINNSASLWQRGYIYKRLALKCRENSVELVEVWAKGISRECSCCGEMGRKQDGIFKCKSCGYYIEEKINTARNAKKRGKNQ